MADFRKFKGLNIKYRHRDPQNAHLSPEQRLLTLFVWKSVQGFGLKNSENERIKLVRRRWQDHVFW